eukprot:scaffold1341_cov178-Amphora_coffeaeformis.AAC.39
MTTLSKSTDANKPASNNEFNVFRDTPIRYLGYSNEVGESFRYQFPRFVTPSYLIAFGYCCADAAQAGWRVWSSPSSAADNETSKEQRQHDSFRAMVDTAIWQTTASVMVPGFTINCIVKATRWMVRRPAVTAALPAVVFQWLPTATGLGSIPLIVQPIDKMTDVLMDETLRKWWKPATNATEVNAQ